MDQDRSARVKTIVEMLRRHIRDAEARRFERIDSEEETRDASPAPGPSTNPQQPATTNRKRSKTGDGTRVSSESDQEERDVDPTPGTSTDNVQPRVKRKRSKDPSSRSTTTLSSSNMLDTNRNDFSSTSATTVFEDDRLKAFCQKKRSHRYTKHGINGIVYRIWFAPKQNVPLLVVSLTSMFKQVIKYVLEKLQQAFSEEENRQIYMTFSAEGINHELNT
ncbi:uncharacterized protein LOC131881260 isoform X3 [Tigriopus californicus]|uniref:uncharacterized protein LOC131881260 isoform X3 n=1 Tax=Tigriopus californicus TaxID=6832 RepID=UPI0027D9ED11|nr:uncharacterized protein LOC131881260 isoform X3 [Tigriopus californicus]